MFALDQQTSSDQPIMSRNAPTPNTQIMQHRPARPGPELSQGEDPTMRRGTAAAEPTPV
jgi:hypothetical protein